MPQSLDQIQQQRQIQGTHLTQQQMLQVKLLEMPLAELEQNVLTELNVNPALESAAPEEGYADNDMGDDQGSSDDQGGSELDIFERQERKDALAEALERIGSDDRMPEATPAGGSSQGADYYMERIYAGQASFYDQLREQMGETTLTGQQQEVMDYLIGSLDDNGWLTRDLGDISDELAFRHGINVSEAEIGQVLAILQTFDPAGIGARSLEECLLLQIDRREPSTLTSDMRRIVADCFDDAKNRRWEKIERQLNISHERLEQALEKIRLLNPKPGAALNEPDNSVSQQITPDFLVDTADDGTVTFALNRGNIPELFVAQSFLDLMDEYQGNRQNMNRQRREALLYARNNVERARGYIEAVKQRRRTMYVTMKAIIDLQKRYFQSGDEDDMRPMVLKDVAQKTGLDISTVSRVCNAKYAQTRWGTFRLRHFFSEGVKAGQDEATSNRKLKAVLKDIVSQEDKHHPLSDDALVEEMKKQGYTIARRTISKYRGQLGIPKASLRKE